MTTTTRLITITNAAHTFLDDLITTYKITTQILTDNLKEFTSMLFATLYTHPGNKKSTTTAYCP